MSFVESIVDHKNSSREKISETSPFTGRMMSRRINWRVRWTATPCAQAELEALLRAKRKKK